LDVENNIEGLPIRQAFFVFLPNISSRVAFRPRQLVSRVLSTLISCVGREREFFRSQHHSRPRSKPYTPGSLGILWITNK
jgi:hypothetical protein